MTETLEEKTLKTNVIFILDESGSMAQTASDVRGGFNTYVEALKGDGNDYSLSAIKFGSTVRPLFADVPLDQVPLLTLENYMPLDSTALYDAIGHGLACAEEMKTEEQERYLMIIMTDGFENASRKYSKEEIVARIKEREATGYWTFVYLGADQDAWAIASTLGFVQGNVLAYASCDTGDTFAELASSTTTTTSSRYAQTRTFFGGGK